MYYINYFYLTSILGFLIETICYLIFNWSGNSGYLFGPWTPVYGFGAILIIVTYNFLNKKIKNQFLKCFCFILSISILLSLIELIGGYLIEFIFHEILWDYSDQRFHLGKYISLEMTLVWIIMSLIFIYIAKPFIDSFIHVFPKTITYILTILFIIDNIITILIKLKLI